MAVLLPVLMVLAALFLLDSEWEKLQLETCIYQIPTEKTNDQTLVFLSDLHDYLPARYHMEQILDRIDAAAPSAVLVGGDMITVSKYRRKPAPETETALELLRRIREKYPVIYAEGNHEARLLEKNPEGYAAYVEALRQMGVQYLANRGTRLSDTVAVYGITLPDECYRHLLFHQGETVPLPEGFLEGVLRPEKEESDGTPGFRIGLIHSPRYLPDAAKAGLDLVLSGHYHGGTIRLPDGSGLMTPQYQFFIRECSGQFREGTTAMIVNRGLGTHSIKVRIHDLPEVSVIRIEHTDHVPAGETGL